MTLDKIIKDYLEKNGYAGLANVGFECGCGLDNLQCCDEPPWDCVPGHKVSCSECGKMNCLYIPEAGGGCIFAGKGKDDAKEND